MIVKAVQHINFNSQLLQRCKLCRRLVSTWSPLAVAFNTKPTERADFQSLLQPSATQGLFGIPSLVSYPGVYALKERGIAESDKLLDECCDKNRTRKLVQVFDDLSDSICRVADLCEFIRIMHPEAEFCYAAEDACIVMSGIVEKLNTNKELYDCIKEAAEHGDKFPMTDEEKHVIDLFIFDFEQCGIHLPEKDRTAVVHYNDSILQLGQKFMHRASQSRTIDKDIIPPSLQQYYSVNQEGKLIVHGYSDITDEFGREMAYKIYLAPSAAQSDLLDEILTYRHKLAQKCGFPTYAHRALRGSTAETPEFVHEFLNGLNKELKDKVNEDFDLMRKEKASESNRSLAMWDVPYYTSKLKRKCLKSDSRAYSPYFSLGACMDGLNNLFNNLFSISLVEEKMKHGESWSPDVYKLAVKHSEEGLLGYIYCDFYERPEKPYQDCHYTIQGGRRLSDQSYQNPIVVVVLNLPKPYGDTPCLLTPGMVENLFHEMGHAIHSMLGRAEYQHITGTRCVTDFAEVPSVLMEYFASNIDVLKTFAKHYKTEEPIPDEMLTQLCEYRNKFVASELQGQIFYSMLDHSYHTQDTAPGRTAEILADVQSTYYPVPFVENTAWHLKFSHLIGYGAKYYSYLMSRAIASSIWQTYFRNNPFDSKMGEKYRRECLAHGGGKPPRRLVKDYLNKEITPKGLTESLVNEINVHYDKKSW
ncbi:mitochondrial intermediate peptidase [Planococcus citri]|uniref:mitochondrial intermediate peptidase n=1 Tax=Planococcus citri TaxID=170843 RepID=UPI0031F7F148